MKAILITASALAMAVGPSPVVFAQSSSSQVERDGSCPSGFKSSGSSCKSSSGKVAITKLGSCPKGFSASANFCVGDKGDYAEVRSGSCPTGLKASGNYCVK